MFSRPYIVVLQIRGRPPERWTTLVRSRYNDLARLPTLHVLPNWPYINVPLVAEGNVEKPHLYIVRKPAFLNALHSILTKTLIELSLLSNSTRTVI